MGCVRQWQRAPRWFGSHRRRQHRHDHRASTIGSTSIWRSGSSLGYASVGFGSDPRGGFLDVESRRVSLFGTYYRQNAMHVDGLIAYGSTAYDSLRRLGGDAQGVGPAIARSSAAGKQFSGALTSALDLQQRRVAVRAETGRVLPGCRCGSPERVRCGRSGSVDGRSDARSRLVSRPARISRSRCRFHSACSRRISTQTTCATTCVRQP